MPSAIHYGLVRPQVFRPWPSGFRSPVAGVVLAGLVVLASVLPTRPAKAQDDILLIGKSALYGAATGLLLGGVTALVVDSKDRGDAVRWGIVLGTFGGFAYGVYKVSRSDEDMFLRQPDGQSFGASPMVALPGTLAELGNVSQAHSVRWALATRAPASYLGTDRPGATPLGTRVTEPRPGQALFDVSGWNPTSSGLWGLRGQSDS